MDDATVIALELANEFDVFVDSDLLSLGDLFFDSDLLLQDVAEREGPTNWLFEG
jgi:hypothetical protein